MRARRGFSILELVTVVAILALLAAVATNGLGAKRGAAAAAARQFDGVMAAALAVASSSGDGATLVFSPEDAGPGSRVRIALYAGRPDGAASPYPAGVPAADLDAGVAEDSLGQAPFALFLTSAGRPSGLAGYADSGGSFVPVPAEPPCPPGGYRLTFQAGPESATRTLPCG